jgi:hypothetical protein
MAIAPLYVLSIRFIIFYKVMSMKLLRNKIWYWWDISLLKWCCFLFGIAAGAYFHEAVMPYVWGILVAAVLLTIRPTIAYFKD